MLFLLFFMILGSFVAGRAPAAETIVGPDHAHEDARGGRQDAEGLQGEDGALVRDWEAGAGELLPRMGKAACLIVSIKS